MTTLLDTRPRTGEERRRRGASAAPHAHGRRPTLEARLSGHWHEAKATGTTDCPLCGETMTHTGSAAICGGCGTELS